MSTFIQVLLSLFAYKSIVFIVEFVVVVACLGGILIISIHDDKKTPEVSKDVKSES